MVGRRLHVDPALGRDAELRAHHDVLHAAVVGTPVARGEATLHVGPKVEVAAQHGRGGPAPGPHRRQRGGEQVVALGPGDGGVAVVQVRGAGRERGRVEAEPGPLLRVGGVLGGVDPAGGERRGAPGQHGDPVGLTVHAAHRLTGAPVHRRAERGRAHAEGAFEHGDVGPADLVERHHVRRLRADHLDGGGHGPARVAARQPAVAQVHLQHAHPPVRRRSRRGQEGDEHGAPHEQPAPHPPSALHAR